VPWHTLAGFCAVYFAAVATPGPGVAAVIAQSLARGAAGAPAFIAGFVAGDLIWFLGAALGLSALAQAAHGVFVVLKFVGAGYLLYLAYRLWSTPAAPIGRSDDMRWARQTPRRLFIGSLTLTLGNPKPMIFYIALLPTVVPLETLTWGGYLEMAVAAR
jgi:threonine/homoserine/homoserine lactone efflux protein